MPKSFLKITLVNFRKNTRYDAEVGADMIHWHEDSRNEHYIEVEDGKTFTKTFKADFGEVDLLFDNDLITTARLATHDRWSDINVMIENINPLIYDAAKAQGL